MKTTAAEQVVTEDGDADQNAEEMTARKNDVTAAEQEAEKKTSIASLEEAEEKELAGTGEEKEKKEENDKNTAATPEDRKEGGAAATPKNGEGAEIEKDDKQLNSSPEVKENHQVNSSSGSGSNENSQVNSSSVAEENNQKNPSSETEENNSKEAATQDTESDNDTETTGENPEDTDPKAESEEAAEEDPDETDTERGDDAADQENALTVDLPKDLREDLPEDNAPQMSDIILDDGTRIEISWDEDAGLDQVDSIYASMIRPEDDDYENYLEEATAFLNENATAATKEDADTTSRTSANDSCDAAGAGSNGSKAAATDTKGSDESDDAAGRTAGKEKSNSGNNSTNELFIDNKNDEVSSTEEDAEASVEEIADLRLLEIRLLDQEENEIQPQGKVHVRISLGESMDYDDASGSVRLLHYKSETPDADQMEEIEAEPLVTEGNVEEVTFTATSFSVYAIVKTTETKRVKITRRTYSFQNDDGTDYTFTLKLNGGTTTTAHAQIVRNGDTLQDVGTPIARKEENQKRTFTGWQVVTVSGGVTDLSDGQIITLPMMVNSIDQDGTDDTVTLQACFGTVNVTFHNGDGSILRVAQATAGSTLNLASYYADTNITRDGRTLTFFGWSTDANAAGAETSETSEIEVLGNSYSVPDHNIDLYPVYRYGFWLNFNTNDDDGDPTKASYTESAFVGNAKVQTSNKPEDPTRAGYTFGGWYDDAACTYEFSFNNTTLTGNTTVYARWVPAETAYTVIFWLQDANDDEYAYAGELQEHGNSKATTNYQIVGSSSSSSAESSLPEAIAGIRQYLSLNTTTHPIEQQQINGDGSTIVNVYFDRKEYTLRFYYAYAAARRTTWWQTTTTYHIHTETSNYSNAAAESTDEDALSAQAGTRQIEISRIPTPIGDEDTGSTQFIKNDGTTYTYYYFDITAKYGENIESSWPAAPFEDTYTSGRNTYSFISWASRNGSEYYSSHDNKNIKGIYSVLDSSLIINPEAKIAQSFLAYWNTPTMYTYQIYYSLLDGESSDIIYNGTGYKLQETYEVGSTAVWNQQNALSLEGVTAVSETPVTHSGQTRNMGGNVGFAYQRNLHSITFMTPDGEQIAKDEGIPYGEDLSKEAVVGRHEEEAAAKAPEWSAFAGWYDNQEGNGTPFSFTGTMPDNDLILYANYKTNRWTVTFQPNGGTFPSGQANTARVENGGNISDQEATLNQTAREGYELVGWFKEGEDTPYNFSDPVTEDFTLEAHWRQAGTYYVRYVYDADTDENNSQLTLLQIDPKTYVDQGEVVTLGWPTGADAPAVPEGKVFIGWQLVSAGTVTSGTSSSAETSSDPETSSGTTSSSTEVSSGTASSETKTSSGASGTDTSAVIYRPGEKLVLHAENTTELTEEGVTRNYLTLQAVFNTFKTTFIKYDANRGEGTLTELGDDIEGNDENTRKDISWNDAVQLSSGTGFSRKGYELAGWNTNKDADGTDAYADTRYALGDTYAADASEADADGGNTLYAEWRIVITIRKTDRNDQSLSGAVFRLTTERGQVNAAAASGITDGIITIGEDGTAVIKGLPVGSYVLREIQAPTGYLALGAIAVITITPEGMTVVDRTLDNQETSELTFELDETDGFAIKVVNRRGTPLPEAGFSGEVKINGKYLLILALLSLAIGAWTYHHSTRGQRRNE